MVLFYIHTLNNLRQYGTLQTFKPFKLLFPQHGTRNDLTPVSPVRHPF